ncbi:hypothetical protein SSBR45G_22430 [Bradyrhizobium sp. SSBR45G]|uniref:hypothetical protein n=1 Tax=unclassified Bradyrhizobium TaxID=2631580 RepID=UPI002342B602|nr:MULTISPECIES: hypothetical protein [unclassified Bradyrhizobium]GLH77335.1 hypothetical protein SSBR45G_22430 [Bradyrhizobium sp. SSBR45G]GLH84559.1 hypothetical protein SSBR45R_20190 [Bradyrhizobium sp. SSBR45R]
MLVGSCVLAVLTLIAAFMIFFDAQALPDHFSQIERAGDRNWYRNFGGRQIPQIQDQDIFYSNIGSSIAAARAADVVFLGPSFVSYAIDRQTLQSSDQLNRLKLYNMAFVGIRGGEFSRRVIGRWDIRAPLWVINVDDQFAHFFSRDLNVTLGPQKVPLAAVTRDRLRGYLTVIGRNLRWRLEDVVSAAQAGQFSDSGLYRSVSTGDMALEVNPSYVAAGNKPMRSERDQACDIPADAVSNARAFLKEIGGQVVFMLVPHSQSCVRQAEQLAGALGVELIAPPFDGLTTLDGGGHLDKKGAETYTRYLADELVKTRAFKAAFASRTNRGAGAAQ